MPFVAVTKASGKTIRKSKGVQHAEAAPRGLKGLKSRAGKRAAKQVRVVRVIEVPAEWASAIDDIVASAIARDHVDGKPCMKRAAELRVLLSSYVPRARWTLHTAFGHPPSKTACRCRSYALLHIDAVELSRVKRIPVEALFQYARMEFDSYMDGRQ